MDLEALKEKCEEDMWIDSDIVLKLIEMIEKKEHHRLMTLDALIIAQQSASERLGKIVELQKEHSEMKKALNRISDIPMFSDKQTLSVQKAIVIAEECLEDIEN